MHTDWSNQQGYYSSDTTGYYSGEENAVNYEQRRKAFEVKKSLILAFSLNNKLKGKAGANRYKGNGKACVSSISSPRISH